MDTGNPYTVIAARRFYLFDFFFFLTRTDAKTRHDSIRIFENDCWPLFRGRFRRNRCLRTPCLLLLRFSFLCARDTEIQHENCATFVYSVTKFDTFEYYVRFSRKRRVNNVYCPQINIGSRFNSGFSEKINSSWSHHTVAYVLWLWLFIYVIIFSVSISVRISF